MAQYPVLEMKTLPLFQAAVPINGPADVAISPPTSRNKIYLNTREYVLSTSPNRLLNYTFP